MCMNYSIFYRNSATILLQIITNNSYDILKMSQNLTDRVGSPPILKPKATTQKKNFS